MKTDNEIFYAHCKKHPAHSGYFYTSQWRKMYVYAKSKQALDAFITEQKLIVNGGFLGGGIVLTIFTILVMPTLSLMIKGNLTLFYFCISLAIISLLFCLWAGIYCKKLQKKYENQIICLPMED